MNWMRDLPVTRVVAAYVPDRPVPVDVLTSSRVRGALEAHLRQVVCVACSERDHVPGCIVPAWWRRPAQEVPRWWIRVAPEPGVLVGPDRPLVVSWGALGEIPRPTALVEAFVRTADTGVALGPMGLDSLVVHGDGVPTLVEGRRVLAGYWPGPSPLSRHVRAPGAGGATIRLVTPFQPPQAVSDVRPTVASWLRSAIGRVRGTARSVGVQLATRWPDPDQARGAAQLWPVTASRPAVSQPGDQDLSGWVGLLRLEAPAASPFVDLLAAAEVLGVGRGVTRGLGAVEVDWDS